MQTQGMREKSQEIGGLKKAVLCAALAIQAWSCAPLSRSGVEFEGLSCGQTDQYRSYMNPIDSTRVQTISVDARFSSTQVARIQRAVDQWNAQSRATLGKSLFTVKQFSLSMSSVPSSASDCGFPGTPSGFSIVSVPSEEAWTSLGLTKQNPGVTIRCAAGKDFVAKQVILMNSWIDQEIDSFENVVLHEIGHAVGLHHSCDGANRGDESFRGCSELNSFQDPYRQAVMYPYVDPSRPKTELSSNDEERATCALNYRP
jgi:hypothetical protein